MHEVKHPKWGSNLANQLSAANFKKFGEDGAGNCIVSVRGLFGGEKMKKKYVGEITRPSTNEDRVTRRFMHQCGLLKIVMTQGRKGPLFIAFFDGHTTSEFVSNETEFHFAPKELQVNEGNPIADVWFYGTGTRWGPFDHFGTSRIICTFADKEQMNEYLDVTNRRMPKSIMHKGVTYSPTGSGEYRSSDGSILPYLVLLYLMLPQNEQSAFAAQNPEVQNFVGAGGESGGAGNSSVFDAQLAESSVVYENEAGSSSYDSGSSSYDSSSSSSSDSSSSSSSSSGSE